MLDEGTPVWSPAWLQTEETFEFDKMQEEDTEELQHPPQAPKQDLREMVPALPMKVKTNGSKKTQAMEITNETATNLQPTGRTSAWHVSLPCFPDFRSV